MTARSMQQLPLRVGPADHAVFDNFLPGPNAAVLHALKELATVASRGLLWAWGPAESGRTHLLQATVAAAEAAGFRGAYLPAGESGLPPLALDGLDAFDVVCLDDVDRVAGDPDWERRLFQLFESLRGRQARLVLSASRAPLHAGFALPDLASRLTSGATFRLRALDDGDKQLALQQRAAWRGLDLPEDTAQYLLTRTDRSTTALFRLLDRLDTESLVAQRPLTVPFVRRVLDGDPPA